VTTTKLLSRILVSPPNPKVVAAINGVVTSYLGGIVLFNFFYYNRGSKYITEPYRKCYGGLVIRPGI